MCGQLPVQMTTLPFLAGNCGGQERTKNSGFRFGSYTKDAFGKDSIESSLSYLNSQLHEAFRLNNSRSGNRNGLQVVARVKKGKKHEYPWPDNLDPNMASGHLTYLSHFKPLTEKPKPVTLPFEKPLVDLEQKIIEISRMADETGLDFSDQIGTLERKYQQALKDLYTHLTPIQRLSIARHPNRPTVLDHILNITEKWVELHGDRAGYDDPAIVTGIGSINGKSYMFVGHQKGRNTKENIARNFAMPTPHGYRKALRLMKYADHHGFPIITLIDTPGAFADLKSEELGQGEAIAYNLRAMFGFKVPIITIVTGEGGSGGALAIACANKLYMLENSAFYVASPEACAAILWKSSQAAPKAAEKLRITAQEHYRLGIADGIIPEPLGGAHADPSWTSQQIKFTIVKAMEELASMSTEELLHHRMLKYRSIGGFQEGVPVEPQRKRSMKQSDVNTSTSDLESEIENLKKKIIEAKGPSDPVTSDTIEKLKEEVDKDITNAFISMGLEEKLQSVKLELSRSSRQPDQPLSTGLQEKVDAIMREFKNKFSQPGAYLGLKKKLEKLNSINRLIELKQKRDKLEAEINQKLHNEMKAKMELIKNAEEKTSQGEDLDRDMLEEVESAKEDLKEVLKSANLEIIGVRRRNSAPLPPELEDQIVNVNKEINQEIEKAVLAAGLSSKIEKMKAEVLNGSPLENVQKLQAEIKEEILAALNAEHLKEKVEDIRSKLAQSTSSNTKIGAANGRY